jgi:hypothetical protein
VNSQAALDQRNLKIAFMRQQQNILRKFAQTI